MGSLRCPRRPHKPNSELQLEIQEAEADLREATARVRNLGDAMRAEIPGPVE